MKKLTAILLLLMAVLGGCARESAYQPAGVENVTMTVSDVTPAGATVEIRDDNREPFVYGEWFVIEQEKDVESITFVGLCTDICVISNAMLTKAFFPEIPLIVDAKGCAGVTPESHKNALNAMKMCQVEILGE